LEKSLLVGEMGGNEYYDSEQAVTNADSSFVIRARQTWSLNPLSEFTDPNSLFSSLVMADGNFVTRQMVERRRN
jgi:hypothetical protein